MKRQLKAVVLGIALVTSIGGWTAPARADDMKDEMREHPRLAKAMHDLEDAIRYMEAAPHDFGGHKAEAIADSRRALESLHRAAKYREHHDHDHEHHDDRH